MNKPDPHHSLVSARWMLRLSMLSVVLLLVWAGLSHIDQVKGQVVYVSPDTLLDETRQGAVPYYRVHIALEEAVFKGQKANAIHVKPGMTATVEIKANTRDIAWGYTAEQTDVAGNVSPKGSLSVMVDTATPPVLDMDAISVGIQASAQRLSSASELRAGTPFAANVVPPAKATASAIDVVFSGTGLDLANDRLLLDALVALDANLAPVSGKTVGGVADVSYVYTTATRTLNITKSTGGTFSGTEIEAIVESIKLQNLTPTAGNRVITLSLRDDAGLVGPSMQSILSVGSDVLMLDLDPGTAGLQISSSLNLTDAAQLAAGVAFDDSVAAPSSTQVAAIKVVLGGAGLDPDNDRLLLDAPLALNADLATAGGKTVGGVTGLSYGYDSTSRTLTLRKGDNGNWSGSEVQSVVQAIKLAGKSLVMAVASFLVSRRG